MAQSMLVGRGVLALVGCAASSLELTNSAAYSTLSHMKHLRDLLVLLLALAVAGVAVGCWHRRAEQSGGVPPETKHEQARSPIAPSTVPRTGEEGGVAFTLYFPSREYVETGRDSVDRLIAESITLEPALVAAGNDRVAAALLQALGRGPTSAAALPVIPARIQIRSVHVRERIAELDLARAGLSGGSLEEQLFVQSIVRTLTQLPELHAVRFLVDGKPTETLMGHVSTARPLRASD
jgi:germination protein M